MITNILLGTYDMTDLLHGSWYLSLSIFPEVIIITMLIFSYTRNWDLKNSPQVIELKELALHLKLSDSQAPCHMPCS